MQSLLRGARGLGREVKKEEGAEKARAKRKKKKKQKMNNNKLTKLHHSALTDLPPMAG